MKTKTIITEITHDDIVNLLSTGIGGSLFLGVSYREEEYRKIQNSAEYDCIEDKCAKLLLNGNSIVIFDLSAEDEDDFYGKLYHAWDSEYKTMDYIVTLSDIKKGLQKAIDNGGWNAKCAFDLMCDDSCFDAAEAENLLQIIIFGEAIYG